MVRISREEYEVVNRDLKRAERFLELLAELKRQEGPAAHREALSLAAVVSYYRPFTKCRRHGEKGKRPWIPAALVDELPLGLKRLHDHLKDQRNEIWAHTDGTSAQAELRQGGRTWSALTRVAIAKFQALIAEVRSRLEV